MKIRLKKIIRNGEKSNIKEKAKENGQRERLEVKEKRGRKRKQKGKRRKQKGKSKTEGVELNGKTEQKEKIRKKEEE